MATLADFLNSGTQRVTQQPAAGTYPTFNIGPTNRLDSPYSSGGGAVTPFGDPTQVAQARSPYPSMASPSVAGGWGQRFAPQSLGNMLRLLNSRRRLPY